MGYSLWDVDNHKIIRSRDAIFNEKIMYKDRLQNNEEPKFVTLDDVDEHKKHDEQIEALPQQEPQTPPIVVTRSSRISKVTKHYSPSLYHVLYNDSGELDYFDEAMQGST